MDQKDPCSAQRRSALRRVATERVVPCRRDPRLVVLLGCAAVLWGATLAMPARAATAGTPGPVEVVGGAAAATAAQGSAERDCAALAREDFGAIPDAPTHVTAARFVAASARTPAHCEVQAYVSPAVGFGLWLPARDWNGKFAQIGCGGFCGGVFPTACDGVLAHGYACVATDMGHKSSALDAKWAYNNLQAEVDFAFRATHVVTLAGKAITARFYQQGAKRAYFLGCSTGGRQGLVEAQKFPWDYDGIVAGAPVIDETGDGMALLWNVLSLHDRDGRPLLSAAEIERVHRAAVARCDRDDGVADGLIGDPRRCGFDPAELACRDGQAGDCLGTAQVEAVRKVYQGPRNSRGEALYTGGALPGSELNWLGNYVARDGGPSTYRQFMGDMFRYMNFMPDPGPAWQLHDFDWDRDPQRLGLMEALYSGENPDLRRFAARGGKVIAYQGWADQSVLPLNVVDYYETVERTMGGRAPTQDFFRLFMIPGMNHCLGGDGAWAVDYLGHLEAWVEQGRAPDQMLSAHPRPDLPARPQFGSPMPEAAHVEFSRPLYPYPLQPKLRPRADPRAAASYLPQPPQPATAPRR